MEEEKKEIKPEQEKTVSGGAAALPNIFVCPECGSNNVSVTYIFTRDGKRIPTGLKCRNCGNEWK